MTVSISFVLAVTLWFLVTLNIQTYSTEITYPVKLVNLPDKYQLENDFPSNLIINTEGKGIKLLYQVFENQRDTVKIDFSRFGPLNYFLAHENIRVINQVLPPGLKALFVYPDSIPLNHVAKKSKRVPVDLRANISPAPTFRFTEPPSQYPESVIVFGPQVLLDTLSGWPTKKVDYKDLRTETNLYIPLDTIRPFEIFTKDVRVHVKPEPFTENRLTLKVKPINLPLGTRLRLMPDTVNVAYLVPLHIYGRLTPRDFELVVDYEKIRPYQTYLFPEMQKMPDKIEIIRMMPGKINYMIEKEKNLP